MGAGFGVEGWGGAGFLLKPFQWDYISYSETKVS